MKFIPSVFLLAAVLAAAQVNCPAQTNSPATAPEAADDKQKASLEKHLKQVFNTLKLEDEAKEAGVRKVMSAFFIAHDSWHQANDAKLKELWNAFNHARSKQDKAGADKALADIDSVYASFKPQHDQMIHGLAAVLSSDQIAAVEDALNVNKVKVTYNVYLQIFPTLTAEQKAFVLKNLETARDESVDAGSKDEKIAFFKKYKIKIEDDYLTAQGYDPKQARKDFAAKGKTGDAAK